MFLWENLSRKSIVIKYCKNLNNKSIGICVALLKSFPVTAVLTTLVAAFAFCTISVCVLMFVSSFAYCSGYSYVYSCFRLYSVIKQKPENSRRW